MKNNKKFHPKEPVSKTTNSKKRKECVELTKVKNIPSRRQNKKLVKNYFNPMKTATVCRSTQNHPTKTYVTTSIISNLSNTQKTTKTSSNCSKFTKKVSKLRTLKLRKATRTQTTTQINQRTVHLYSTPEDILQILETITINIETNKNKN